MDTSEKLFTSTKDTCNLDKLTAICNMRRFILILLKLNLYVLLDDDGVEDKFQKSDSSIQLLYELSVRNKKKPLLFTPVNMLLHRRVETGLSRPARFGQARA